MAKVGRNEIDGSSGQQDHQVHTGLVRDVLARMQASRPRKLLGQFVKTYQGFGGCLVPDYDQISTIKTPIDIAYSASMRLHLKDLLDIQCRMAIAR